MDGGGETTSGVSFRLLGSLEVARDGVLIRIGAAKPQALLTMLLVNANRVVPSDVLIEQLWDGEPPASAVATLQGYVSTIRRALGADSVQRRPPGYVLEIDADQLDIREFERLVAEGRAAHERQDLRSASHLLHAALDLWRGSALSDVADQTWARGVASQLDQSRLQALEAWFSVELELGHHAEITGRVEAAVAAQPLREHLRHVLMLALYRSGRQADALRAFQDVRAVLADELGIDPSPDLVRLEAAILAQDPRLQWRDSSRPTIVEPAAPLHLDVARPSSNLRSPLTSLIGRSAEIAELAELVRHNRLVTVAGPGGAGKTRIALETAARVVDGFSAGAWLVELAHVTDPIDVAEAVAAALQLTDPGLDPRGRILEFLDGRMILLILDNCEHVVDAVARLATDILAANPLTFILTTTREPLNIGGEHVWSLPPMQHRDTVELFADRASAVVRTFRLDESTSGAVDEICRRLDGMPLAVELAAARCRAFSPQQLAARLSDRFALLTAGSRLAEPRQQTLRGVVDWSYNLLFEDERLLFQRLSTFADSCTLESIEQICADPAVAPSIPAESVAETLARLVDKSVVHVHHESGGSRYGMLETLIQYGREHLPADQAAALGAVHAAHYGELAAAGVTATRGREQRAWLAQVTAEQGNIRAALAWSVANGDSARASAMIAGLGWYWWAVGGVSEGWRWAEQVQRFPAEGPPSTRALSLTWSAFLAVCCEQHEPAGPLIIEADQTARTAWDDDPISMTYCRLLMARVESIRGNRPRGRSWMIEAGQMMELLEPTDPWVIGTRPYVIGQIAFMGGNPREAVPLLGEAAHLLDHHGDRANATICFAEMAFAAETYGDYDTMRDALHNAQRIAHEFNLTSIELVLAARIGCAAVLQGHHDEAEVLLDEVLRSARDVAHRPALAYALTGVARLRFRQGRMAEAEAAAREALAFPLLDQTQVRASSLEILEAINAT